MLRSEEDAVTRGARERAGIGTVQLRTLLLSTVFLAGAGHAWGQAAASPNSRAQSKDQPTALEEVVVTATRREELLGRVPISVTAFTQKTLDREGVRTIDDIVRLTPSLNFTRSSGTGAGFVSNISIRGINSLVGAATTGVYIDDTPIQLRSLLIVSGDPFPKVFDLDRVEVLRGPQGTLFGAGAEGGVVRFITPQPNFNQFSGMARVEAGDTVGGSPSYEVGLAAGGPIVDDKLAFRASGWYREDGGWIDRANPSTNQVLQHDSNSEQSYAGKFALSLKVTPQLVIAPSVYYQDVHDDGRTEYWENISSGGNFREGSLVPEPADDKYVLPALRIQYDNAAFSVISNTSYFHRDYQSTFEYEQQVFGLFGIPPNLPVASGLPGGEDASTSDIKQNNVSEELRIQSAPSSRLQWVVGGFYTHNNQDGDQFVTGLTSNAIFQSLLGADYQQLFGSALYEGKYSFYTHLRSLETQKAFFTDLTYPITDKLKINAGVRVAAASFSYNQVTGGPLIGPTPEVTGGTESETPVTPKFGLSYQADPNDFYYFSAAKGYRIGGAQPQLISLCNTELASLGYAKSPTSYQSDSLWS
jgi:iron complex outermembrane receptor protein